ncbi:MAG: chemotaxis protein [Nitrosomonadales bacterium]|nr:chemotaxis protein [Nitrosomonadales bacterium]
MYMRQLAISRTDLHVQELRSLLAAVSENVTQHLFEVEADLMQTMFLLNEAIEKLGQNFTAIHQAVSDQQNKLDELLAHQLEGPALDAKQVQDIRDMRDVIGDEVNAAVTGLQFHDLTSQLLSRTINRVNGLRDLLLALNTHGEVMSADHEHEDIARLLEEMSEGLKLRSVALDGGLRQSVRQQHMGCGEIELF